MARIPVLTALALTAAIAALSLRSCGPESVEAGPPPGGSAQGIVILPDGSTYVAATDSLPREIAEWLAGREGTDAEFAFSGFVEDRADLTSAGLGQAADLATILRAAPAASLKLSGDEAQAKALAHILDARGISEDRMSVVPSAGLGTVMLKISRGSSVPLMTAKS